MTTIERMARAIAQVDHNGRIAEDGYWSNRDTGSDHHREQARAALTAVHGSFVDPVVRNAIQAALDERP